MLRVVSAAGWAHFKFWIWNQVSSPLFLRHFKSDLGVWGIVGTGSASKFRIWTKTNTKTKPNGAKTKNIAKTKVLVNFWATVICWVSNGMYLQRGIQWWPQMSDLNISKTKPNQTKTKDIAKTMVLAFFHQQWHIGYQKLCTQAGKFNGSLRLVIWTNQKPNKKSKTKNIAKPMVLPFLGLHDMFGIKKHVFKLGDSIVASDM